MKSLFKKSSDRSKPARPAEYPPHREKELRLCEEEQLVIPSLAQEQPTANSFDTAHRYRKNGAPEKVLGAVYTPLALLPRSRAGPCAQAATPCSTLPLVRVFSCPPSAPGFLIWARANRNVWALTLIRKPRFVQAQSARIFLRGPPARQNKT